MFASLLAGGAVVATGQAADAASSETRHLLVAELRSGDLVVGTGGTVVRIHSVSRSSGRYAVRAFSPFDTSTYLLKPRSGTTFSAAQRFVVLLRRVPASAVPLTARPVVAPPSVIDGGRP
ncbi:hypothetical protein ASE01_19345 [Nocardioides sp. Root190]|nr:hypothetical protein ASE01_19345 [Nocardioides sp. Root190]